VTWAYRFEEEALRDIRRLDFEAQKRIIRYLDTRVAGRDDPRRFGKPLRGDKFGFWRWRVGDYRIIGQIDGDQIVVIVVRIAHRSTVYED
jgi:mRNA interferase RelE/StbE